jgi:asparagine synthase (glutamine-hydrolysing)
VRKELVSDVPLGVFLSGGIDSSAVAAMMAELTPGNVNSFSIGFRDASFDESAHARLVAEHLGTHHRELILEPSMMVDLVPKVTGALDEPFADASVIPTHLLSRFAREHVKVALGGDGGDELFAGYPTLQAHRLALVYRRLPRLLTAGLVPALTRRLPTSMDNISFDFKAKRFVAGALEETGTRHTAWLGAFGPEARRRLLRPEVSAELDRQDRVDLVASHLGAQSARDTLNQVLYLDMKMYLEGDILVKLDRASMLTSLEARVPLLNADLLDHVARMPLRHKLRGWRTKHLLRQALRERLPAAILQRPKKGFGIPVARWFRGPLRRDLTEALSPDRLAADGYFDAGAVQELVAAHLAGRRDHRKELWTLFVFQRWLETYGARPAVGARASAV